MGEPQENFDIETIPAEGPGGELARVVSEGDPEVMLRVMEKKAALAPRMKAAVEQILLSQTYADDWTIQGEGNKARACLGSAGAERIARNFPITFSGVSMRKEAFEDADGPAYRYVCTGYAGLYGRTIYAEGSYSTRDKFLGKAHEEWRPLEDINEGHIRSAAHHIFLGNAAKELLGIRGLPIAEYQRIMKATGQDGAKSSQVHRGTGSQGGTPAADHPKQAELAKLCIDIIEAGYVAAKDDQGHWMPAPRAESDDRETLDAAKALCEQISSFTGKDGTEVAGRGAKALKGKRLDVTLGMARELKKMINDE